MMTIVFGSVLPWLLIVAGAWLAYQLVRQNGRILLQLESIEKQIGIVAGRRAGAKPRDPSGLPLGTLAPDFELPDLTGIHHKLSEFRGKNVLLTFFNPNCGFCTKMAPDLALLAGEEGGDQAVPIVVTNGDAHENRALVERFGIRCLVLLQKEMEVASTFLAHGTPMGYRIDGEGRIASELAVGSDSLLQLATRIRTDGNESSGFANGSAPNVEKSDRSLSRSRLNRNGLKAGSPAPDFRLPRIDGGELSLADFRGQRVLLVFSDPDCGPCDELALQLQELHIRRSDLHVLVVSRRDAEANRIKAAKLGLSFPIVLQRQWEVSLRYAMFATPIGYLIDELGTIARDVAIGVNPILSLADKPILKSSNELDSPVSGKEHACAN